MNLLQLVIALILLSSLTGSTVLFVNSSIKALALQQKVARFIQTEAQLRSGFHDTIGQALRVNVYSSQAVANAGTANPLSTGGSTSALRADYQAGTPADGSSSWYATVYLSGTDLRYRNQSGTEWTLMSNVSSITWTTTQGILETTAVVNGITYSVWTAIN